jgi:hypothetical protein
MTSISLGFMYLRRRHGGASNTRDRLAYPLNEAKAHSAVCLDTDRFIGRFAIANSFPASQCAFARVAQ